MSKITEQMILECYEAFRAGNLNHVPKAMNDNSAKMSMIWFDSILNTKKSFNRSGSLMQYRVILKKISEDYDNQKAKEAAEVLMEYCVQHNKESHIAILKQYINI